MSELRECPVCHKPVRWCGAKHENEEDEHRCDQIICDTCGINFQFDDRSENVHDTYEEAQAANLIVFNTRPQAEAISALQKKVTELEAKINKNGGMYMTLKGSHDYAIKRAEAAEQKLEKYKNDLAQIGRWCTGEDQIDLAFDDTEALGCIAVHIEKALEESQ